MRLLYISTKNFDNGLGDGVVKKILNHVASFEKAGMSVSYIYYLKRDKTVHFVDEKNDTVIGNYKRFAGVFVKKTIDEFLRDHLKDNDYDVAYIRYQRSDPWFLQILKDLKEHGVRIVLEIPTYPYDGEIEAKELLIDRLFRNRLKEYADTVVTFTSDREIFGIKAISTMNGIDVSECKIADVTRSDKDEISMIAVSTMQYYHGYERMINGLASYYNDNDDDRRDIKLYMVGDGPELEYYKELTAKSRLEDHIVYMGRLSGEQLDDAYNKADLAIGSMGGYKIGYKVFSSIKLAEYYAKGLPIVMGAPSMVSEQYGEEYEIDFPNDDSDIDINRVIEFYDRIYADKSKGSVREEIREFAFRTVDNSVVMKPVIDYIMGS